MKLLPPDVNMPDQAEFQQSSWGSQALTTETGFLVFLYACRMSHTPLAARPSDGMSE